MFGGCQIRPFEKCIEKVKYTTKVASQDFKETGLYPIISQEEAFISGYWDITEDVFHITKPVVIFGDHSRHLKYVDFDFVIGADGVKILSPVDDINAKYFYYYLKWLDIPSLGYSRHFKSLKEKTVKVFPIEEQQRIVDELDLLSGIIDKKNAQLRDLDALAQSIFYEMFGDPIANEKGWEVKKIGDVCDTTSGGTPSKSHPEYYANGTIPWLRSGEVNQRFITETELCITEQGLNNSSAKWFPEDTVAIAMYGATVGQVGIIKRRMTTNQAVCGIMPCKEFIPLYLYHFLLSKKDDYVKQASGGAQPNISQGIVRDTLICCPPLDLQHAFAAKIEAIEQQKVLIKQSQQETQTLLASRMDHYFSD